MSHPGQSHVKCSKGLVIMVSMGRLELLWGMPPLEKRAPARQHAGLAPCAPTSLHTCKYKSSGVPISQRKKYEQYLSIISYEHISQTAIKVKILRSLQRGIAFEFDLTRFVNVASCRRTRSALLCIGKWPFIQLSNAGSVCPQPCTFPAEAAIFSHPKRNFSDLSGAVKPVTKKNLTNIS